MTDENDARNPLAFFEGKTGNDRPAGPSIEIHGKDGKLEASSSHFTAWPAIVAESGEVEVDALPIGRAWHFTQFAEGGDGDGNGAGIWAVFDRDVSFRAGDGVWLSPSQLMRRPRVKRSAP